MIVKCLDCRGGGGVGVTVSLPSDIAWKGIGKEDNIGVPRPLT